MLDKVNRVLRVTDRLFATKAHRAELHWHIPETCHVKVQQDAVLIHCNLAHVRISMPGISISPQVVVGREEPPLGWISRSFDEKVPCTCVLWSTEFKGRTELATYFSIETA